MNGIITASFTKTPPPQVSDSPPEVADLTATPIIRGVIFTWSLESWIQPYKWQYRTQVENGGWSTWKNTLFPLVIRTLTADERESVPTLSADVQIEVRSTDGLGHYGTTDAIDDVCLVLGASAGDITPGSITDHLLDPTVTTRMFTTSDRSTDDLTQGSTLKLTDAAGLAAIANATTHLDTNGLKDTSKVGATLASTVVSGAANGQTAYTKVSNDVGANTIETTVGSQTKIDARVSSTEKTNLESAIGSTLALLDVAEPKDTILLLSGSHANVGSLATPIKTALVLEHVENLNAAAILSALDETALQTAGGVTNGSGTNLADSINSLTAEIEKTAIASVKASSIVPDASSTALFDGTGNLTFGAIGGVGIKSGATVRTPVAIIASMDSGGNSLQLDLTNLKSGQTLDNLVDGSTYKKTTVNEKSGAGYAYIGLNTSGKILGGTANVTAAQLDAAVQKSGAEAAAAVYGDGVSTFVEHTVTADVGGVGVFVTATLIKMRRRKGMTKLRMSCLGYSEDGLGKLKGEILSLALTSLGTPITNTFSLTTAASYMTASLQLTFDAQVPEESDFVFKISLAETFTKVVKFKEEHFEQGAIAAA